MPNDCDNTVIIKGDPEQLKQLLEVITGTGEDTNKLRLANLVPMPDVLNTTIAGFGNIDTRQNIIAKRETGYENWYEWALKVWGTKWGDYETWFNDEEPGMIDLHYQTAWGPFSDSFWETATVNYPGLVFHVRYHEEGMCFYGVGVYHNGKTTHSEHFEGDNYFNPTDKTFDVDDPTQNDEYLDALYEYMDKQCEDGFYAFNNLVEEIQTNNAARHN